MAKYRVVEAEWQGEGDRTADAVFYPPVQGENGRVSDDEDSARVAGERLLNRLTDPWSYALTIESLADGSRWYIEPLKVVVQATRILPGEDI